MGFVKSFHSSTTVLIYQPAGRQLEAVWASQVTIVAKNPPADAGDIRDAGSIFGSGRSPGGGRAAHSSILAWRIPGREEPGRM